MTTEQQDWIDDHREKTGLASKDTVDGMLHQLLLQVAELRAAQIKCTQCYVEVFAGAREAANPAALVVNGMGSCTEHTQVSTGPVLPGRSPGGILVPGN